MNRTNNMGYTDPNSDMTCHVAQVMTPSQTMMLCDSLIFVVSYFNTLGVYDKEDQADTINVVALRHRSQASVLFFDLHAESKGKSDIPATSGSSKFWRVSQ